jgi:hypothetical protein
MSAAQSSREDDVFDDLRDKTMLSVGCNPGAEGSVSEVQLEGVNVKPIKNCFRNSRLFLVIELLVLVHISIPC